MRRASRSRWAALGAAVAVSLGAGGLLTASASVGSGERAVFVPITPCRLFDTRPAPDNVGERSAPLGARDTFSVKVWGRTGNCDLPTEATALVMNVAAIAPSADSFLTVYPSDAARPLAANLNWRAADPPVSNAVTVDVGTEGRISFFNFAGTVQLTADVVGYYADHDHDDRYALRSTGVGTVIVDPAALSPANSQVTWAHNLDSGSASGSSGCVRAQVSLPQGALITGLAADLTTPPGFTNLRIELSRNARGATAPASMGGISQTVGAGPTTVNARPFSGGVVDNTTFSYFVVVCFTAASPFELHDIVITYLYP